MKTAIATTFDVSDVVVAAQPLPEVSYKQAVEALLTIGVPEEDRRTIDCLSQRGYSIDLPRTPAFRPVEACTRYHGRLVADVAYHPFVAAVAHAFRNHRPLCLSPDMIWLLICQGVAYHINAHAEELRPRFVSHPERLRIQVRQDNFVKGSPENAWPEIFHEFTEQIRNHVGPNIHLFVPDFSTTGPVEQAAAEVVLLDAMQSYFKYDADTRCGIPTITLEGTSKDWNALRGRAQGFRDIGLGSWLDVLTPILDQFASASRGDVDRRFWRSIYKFNGISGGAIINGWLTTFFPYMKNYLTGHASVPSKVLSGNHREELETMLYPRRNDSWPLGVSADAFPSGLSRAPFCWHHLDHFFDMEFLGGFVGVAQDPVTMALRPEIGWAVREAELPA